MDYKLRKSFLQTKGMRKHGRENEMKRDDDIISLRNPLFHCTRI